MLVVEAAFDFGLLGNILSFGSSAPTFILHFVKTLSCPCFVALDKSPLPDHEIEWICPAAAVDLWNGKGRGIVQSGRSPPLLPGRSVIITLHHRGRNSSTSVTQSDITSLQLGESVVTQGVGR